PGPHPEPVARLARGGERRYPVTADHRVGVLRGGLDVLRVVVPAVDDDQVLQPPGDQELAIVEYPGVTRAEPAVLRRAVRGGSEHPAEGLRAALGRAEVAGRDVGPVHPDLADLAVRAQRAGLRVDDRHPLAGRDAA